MTAMNVNLNAVLQINLTVLSVRFLFLSKVQSFLSFDRRWALFFFFFLTLARLGILLVGKSGSLVLPVFLFLISSRQKKKIVVQLIKFEGGNITVMIKATGSLQ